MTEADASALCTACGACCDTSDRWPRFSTEDDAALDLIPAALVHASLSRMRCDGNRCSALVGIVGADTRCSIYAIRPDVCRACVPGDDACHIARRARGMPDITLSD
jgi:uncharacterized protein